MVLTEECAKHTLDLLVLRKDFGLGDFSRKHLSVDEFRDLITEELQYSLHTLIPAEKLKEKTHLFQVSYPANWWEALKERFLPKWYKDGHQINYTTVMEEVRFSAFRLYPKFPNIMPEACVNGVDIVMKDSNRMEVTMKNVKAKKGKR